MGQSKHFRLDISIINILAKHFFSIADSKFRTKENVLNLES